MRKLKCCRRWRKIVCLRLCLVPVKYFLENKIFSEMLFSGKENIFKCLVALWKLLEENIFMCLVLFWKCYFPTNFLHFLSYFLSIQTNFITENFKIIAKSQSTAKYPSLVTTNNNPQPPKFIPTTETTPHTTETTIQPTTANSGNQKPQPTASKQNPQPHNRKTTKKTPPTPPQQQQKSKSHKNQNHTQREIGLWVSGEVEGSRSKIGGSKALALGRRL